MNKLNIGIIGLGKIAPVHAEAIQSSSNANLYSCFSSNPEKAESFAEKYSIKGFADLDEFLSDPGLHIVTLCTPNGTHLEYAKRIAKAGKNIVIEKPIEINLQRSYELLRYCQCKNVKIAVIYQNRFLDSVKKLKEAIDSGKFGKIFMADAYVKWFRSQEYYDSAPWRGTLDLDGGGVMINQAIHTVDLMYYLVGEVDWVFSQTGTLTHRRIEGEDNALTLVKYKNGAMGVFQASTSIKPAQPRRIEIHGENGSAILTDNRLELMLNDAEVSGNSLDIPAGADDPLKGFSTEPHKRQYEQIVNAFLNGGEPVVSGQESIHSVAIVNAIYESGRTGEKVSVKKFVGNSLQKEES